MYLPVLSAAPATQPISLSEAKSHLRVDGDDEDTMIDLLIAGAVDHIDGWSGILGRCLVTQTWEIYADSFAKLMRLPLAPIASIDSIKVTDSSAIVTTIAAANYDLYADGLGSFVRFKDAYSFPSDLAEVQAISISFVAGYGAAADVPGAIKSALLLMIGHAYEHRESVVTGTIATELPMSAASLLAPYRRVGI